VAEWPTIQVSRAVGTRYGIYRGWSALTVRRASALHRVMFFGRFYFRWWQGWTQIPSGAITRPFHFCGFSGWFGVLEGSLSADGLPFRATGLLHPV
jgi:hypothetical protein